MVGGWLVGILESAVLQTPELRVELDLLEYEDLLVISVPLQIDIDEDEILLMSLPEDLIPELKGQRLPALARDARSKYFFSSFAHILQLKFFPTSSASTKSTRTTASGPVGQDIPDVTLGRQSPVK